MVKNLPAMETWVQSLGWEDPVEKEMATHSGIFPGKSLWDRGSWQATVLRVTELNMSKWLTLSLSEGLKELRGVLHLQL